MSQNDKVFVQRGLNRDRVIEFEREIQELLKSLLVIKHDLEDLSNQRKDWLGNISKNFQPQDDQVSVYEKKLELLQAQAVLAQLNLKMDVLRLQSEYERQKLISLVEVTKPLQDDESEEDRLDAMESLQRKHIEELKLALDQSLAYRIQLGNFIYDLNTSLHNINLTNQQELKLQENDWKENMNSFKNNMISSTKKCKETYQTIIKEYLILRHNSQVAKEILLRSQNDAHNARTELQRCLERITIEAAEHRERIESSAALELKTLTSDLRNQVIEKERTLEEVTKYVQTIRKQKKKDFKELLAQIKLYQQKYHDLESKRKDDIRVALHELDQLRHSVNSFEEKLQTVASANTSISSISMETDVNHHHPQVKAARTQKTIQKKKKGEKRAEQQFENIENELHIAKNKLFKEITDAIQKLKY